MDYLNLMAGFSGPGIETGQIVIVKGSKRVLVRDVAEVAFVTPSMPWPKR